MGFTGIVIAALMVAGFVIGVIQQVKREIEKDRAKRQRTISAYRARVDSAGWQDMRKG